jgi:lysophospholipase L1-like esterase
MPFARRRLAAPLLLAGLITASGPAAAAPAQARVGSTGGGGSYRVVGFGDSVPSGGACRCTNYVTLVTRALAARYGHVAVVHNHARGGQTTAGVLAQLKDPVVRTEVADSDLVVITVGANDFDASILTTPTCLPSPAASCYASTIAAQRTRLASVLAQVRALQAVHGGSTVVTGYWNLFLDGAVARRRGSTYVRVATSTTLADDRMIADQAVDRGARYVSLYRPFTADGTRDDTRLLAPDGDHPNATGHQVIAAAVLAALPR